VDLYVDVFSVRVWAILFGDDLEIERQVWGVKRSNSFLDSLHAPGGSHHRPDVRHDLVSRWRQHVIANQ
jgi:hypothetical protein